MKLTVDNLPIQIEYNSADWGEIEESLKKLDADKSSFLILTNDNDSYIQCAGGNNKLTVEYREIINKNFRHFIIGKGADQSPLKTVWTQINCRVGPILIHENEVLNLGEAVLILKNFF